MTARQQHNYTQHPAARMDSPKARAAPDECYKIRTHTHMPHPIPRGVGRPFQGVGPCEAGGGNCRRCDAWYRLWGPAALPLCLVALLHRTHQAVTNALAAPEGPRGVSGPGPRASRYALRGKSRPLGRRRHPASGQRRVVFVGSHLTSPSWPLPLSRAGDVHGAGGSAPSRGPPGPLRLRRHLAGGAGDSPRRWIGLRFDGREAQAHCALPNARKMSNPPEGDLFK